MPTIRSSLIIALATACCAACDISGPSTVLTVSVTTHGPEPDALYGVHIGGITNVGFDENGRLILPPKPVEPNGSVSWDVLGGDYPVSLGAYERDSLGGERFGNEWWPENCKIEGDPDRTVHVVEGLTATVDFTVSCS
jgi:hypothetical protein